MTLLKLINIGAAFFLELGALAALGSWGFRAGSSPLMAASLGLGTPLLAALLWGAFVAPRAVVPLPTPLPFILGRVILSLGPVALSGGSPTLAWVVAALIALNTALGVAWGQVALSPRHDGGGPWPQQKLRLEGAGDNR